MPGCGPGERPFPDDSPRAASGEVPAHGDVGTPSERPTPAGFSGPYPTPQERDLIDRVLAGDGHAFRALWEPVEHRVVGFCLHLAGDPQTAHEAVQQTQIAVWRHLSRYEGRASFATWVCAIARRAVADVARRRSRAQETPFTEEAIGLPVRFEADLVEVLAVREALHRLRREHREALLLWAAGSQYDEIATTLGAPVATVRVWVHRARRRLAEELAPERS